MNAAPSIIYQDEVGERERYPGPRLSEIERLPDSLKLALAEFYGCDIHLSPAQEWSLAEDLPKSKSDFLICAPTNSGKTLIAVFRMFSQAIETGCRSVYVSPLKALAEEKFFEFNQIAKLLETASGKQIKIVITTGDYQRTEDFLGSPPPDTGEIVICTPERLEVMFRNPENIHWARAVGTFVFDEFHLLGDARRGTVMETLLTRIFQSCPWSPTLSLSATVGGIDAIRNWFSENERDLKVLEDGYRFPALRRMVVPTSDKNGFVEQVAKSVAEDRDQSVLVFVDTKRNADALAKRLRELLPCEELVSSFHAGLTLSDREARRIGMLEKRIRVMVATTSLKMGVNFPVTKVIVRDNYLQGSSGRKRLTMADIYQMTGRAGRGEEVGEGWIVCVGEEEASFFAEGLESNLLDEIKPQLFRIPDKWKASYRKPNPNEGVDPLNGIVLSDIVLKNGSSQKDAITFLNRTFSASFGQCPFDNLATQFSFLERAKLIRKKEGSEETYIPNPIGKTVSHTGISPESGAILTGFLRSLIKLDEKRKKEDEESPRLLTRLTAMDFLFLAVCSMEGREHLVRKPSKKAIEETRGYVEQLNVDAKPLINLWRNPSSEDYPTRRLLSSLKIPFESESPKATEGIFLKYLRTAILLHKHSTGTKIDSLASEFSMQEGLIENGLKYVVLWVLHSLAQLCDSRRAYKLDFLKFKIFALIEDLNFGSNLGCLLSVPGVGKVTVVKLIENGLDSLSELRGSTSAELDSLGISMARAKKILSFAKRRGR